MLLIINNCIFAGDIYQFKMKKICKYVYYHK